MGSFIIIAGCIVAWLGMGVAGSSLVLTHCLRSFDPHAQWGRVHSFVAIMGPFALVASLITIWIDRDPSQGSPR